MKRSVPLYEQIADCLRQEFRVGRKEGGDRAPSERELIMRFGVSTTTAKRSLNELAAEGLLVRRRGHGTFITDTAVATHVAVYWAQDVFQAHSSPFFRRLYLLLDELLEEKGCQVHHYFVRPDGSSGGSAEALCKDITAGRLHGLLFISRDHEQAQRIEAMAAGKLPCAYLAQPQPGHCTVTADGVGLVRMGVRHAVECGRTGIGLIVAESTDSDRVVEAFQRTLAETHAATRAQWIRRSVEPCEAQGYAIGKQILSGRPRPEALVIADDIVAKGVATAVVKCQVRVPHDLLFISHANKASGLFYPFGVVKLEVDPRDFAAALSGELLDLIAGKAARHETLIAPRLVIDDGQGPP